MRKGSVDGRLGGAVGRMSDAAGHALLLSGPIGRGHDMMAAACAAVLRGDGWGTRTVDSLALLGGVRGRVGRSVARRLMAAPAAQDVLHFGHLRAGSRLALAMARQSNRRLVPALAAELAARPAQLVISVFATGAAAAGHLPVRPGGPASVVLCTDACPHRLWVWPRTDLFLVTSPAAAAAVRRFVPDAPVRIVPPPVRAAFFTAPDQAQARAELRIPGDGACVLLLDSGWGFGAQVEAARRLAGKGVHVLAVTGRDRGADPGWRTLAGCERVQVFGVTQDVPRLMSAADLVITLPGATTCGEARALGKPLMLLDLMPGHGRDNLQQQLDLGNASVCGAAPDAMTASILSVLRRGPVQRPRGDPHAGPSALRAALAGLGLNPPAAPVGPAAGPDPAAPLRPVEIRR